MERLASSDRRRLTALSPDGRRFAHAVDARIVEVWQIDPPELLARLEHRGSSQFRSSFADDPFYKEGPVVIECWSQDARRLVTRSTGVFERDQHWLWDVETSSLIDSVRTSKQALLSPDGRLVAELTSRDSLQIRDVESHRLTAKVDISDWTDSMPWDPAGAESLVWAPDGSMIAVFCPHRWLIICRLTRWSLAGPPATAPPTSHGGHRRPVVIVESPDLVTGLLAPRDCELRQGPPSVGYTFWRPHRYRRAARA